jgi:phosphate transport system permease protein
MASTLSNSTVDRAIFVETPFVRKKQRRELLAKFFFGFMAAAMVVPLILIVGYVIIQGAPSLSWEFLTTNPRLGGIRGGIWSALVGTIYIVTISLCVSAPIGVLSAVYLNEYAKENWFTRIVNLAVVNLAGVPSIVHGLFGLGAFVYAAHMGKSILSASLTLSIMTLPVIIASTKEALSAVPISFREACWNVGATRWQTIRRIVLPNSISGILTGVINRTGHAHRRGHVQSRREHRPVPLQSDQRPMHGVVDAPLLHRDAGERRESVVALRHCHRAPLRRAGGQCDGHCRPRVPALAQEMVTPC